MISVQQHWRSSDHFCIPFPQALEHCFMTCQRTKKDNGTSVGRSKIDKCRLFGICEPVTLYLPWGQECCQNIAAPSVLKDFRQSMIMNRFDFNVNFLQVPNAIRGTERTSMKYGFTWDVWPARSKEWPTGLSIWSFHRRWCRSQGWKDYVLVKFPKSDHSKD